MMTAAALLVVLGAALAMEASGLSMAMGAFVAGVMLSESAFRHQLEAILNHSVVYCSVSSLWAWECRLTSV